MVEEVLAGVVEVVEMLVAEVVLVGVVVVVVVVVVVAVVVVGAAVKMIVHPPFPKSTSLQWMHPNLRQHKS